MSTAWTLGEVMSSATAALGNRTDITLSRASFWANEAYREVWDAMPHDLQEKTATSNTTVNEDKIALPTDFQELLNATLSGASSAQSGADILTLSNIDQIDSASTLSSTPSHYVMYNNYLQLWPIPNSAYSLTIRYRGMPSTLTETTDRFSVGTRFGQAVLLKATAYLAREYRDFDSYRVYENDYVRYLDRVSPDRALKMRERHDMGVSLPRTRA